jgi:pilus assembly protein CpaB
MSGRRTLLVIASALVAALGTALVWLYVQGADSRAQSAAQSAVELRPVLVAKAQADAGAAADSLATVTRSAPPDLAADAFVPGQKPSGRLLYGVAPETILRPSMFTTGVVPLVAKGNQAASISIAQPQRVAALLRQGDDVAVYSYGPGDPNPRLELEHGRVRDVGPDPNAATAAPGAAGAVAGAVSQEIVTFEGHPEDMLKILAITTHGRTAALLINGDNVTPAR